MKFCKIIESFDNFVLIIFVFPYCIKCKSILSSNKLCFRNSNILGYYTFFADNANFTDLISFSYFDTSMKSFLPKVSLLKQHQI